MGSRSDFFFPRFGAGNAVVSRVKVALPFLQREISRKDEGRGRMREIEGKGNRVRGRGSSVQEGRRGRGKGGQGEIRERKGREGERKGRKEGGELRWVAKDRKEQRSRCSHHILHNRQSHHVSTHSVGWTVYTTGE